MTRERGFLDQVLSDSLQGDRFISKFFRVLFIEMSCNWMTSDKRFRARPSTYWRKRFKKENISFVSISDGPLPPLLRDDVQHGSVAMAISRRCRDDGRLRQCLGS